MCVAACPGLAVSLVRRVDADSAEVQLPFEYDASGWEIGKTLQLLDQDGASLGTGTLVKKLFNRKYRTWVLTLRADAGIAARVIGIAVQDPSVTRPLPQARFEYLPDDAVVCRCERVTVGEIVSFIRDNEVRDVNQLKSIRVGMGACGSKTCSVLLPQLFRKAGVDPSTVTSGTQRPLMLEVPMGDIVNEVQA